MRRLVPLLAAVLLAGMAGVRAQQPPPPAPAFAPSNLGEAGVRALAANCAACHGTFGRPAPGATLPGLAGVRKEELLAALSEFKAGRRPATLMHQISKGYTDEELAALADYFSKQSR
jgi:cytochrome c553